MARTLTWGDSTEVYDDWVVDGKQLPPPSPRWSSNGSGNDDTDTENEGGGESEADDDGETGDSSPNPVPRPQAELKVVEMVDDGSGRYSSSSPIASEPSR